jgi:hypothetical protein
MTPSSSPALTEALKLRQRLSSGEKVPLPDLIAFICLSNQSLEKQRVKTETSKDVDFF